MINIERYIPHFVSLTLLVLGAVEKSPAMAYGAVVTLGLILAREAWDKAHVAKVTPPAVSDELKRKVTDLEARITTVEYGIRQRGF